MMLSDIVRGLEQVYKPEGVAVWLDGRNRLLDGERPMDLLLRSEHERVAALVDALADGIAT